MNDVTATASGSDRAWVRRRPACFLGQQLRVEIKQAGRLRTQGPVATARGSVTFAHCVAVRSAWRAS